MPRKKQAILPPTVPDFSQPLELSDEAKALVADVSSRWDLHAPARAMLQLIAEALTKKSLCDDIVRREGFSTRDAKGSTKTHPCADLAYRYQATASAGLQRLLSNLG